jgi:drug/metabolite transporter (DMT)-like permease
VFKRYLVGYDIYLASGWAFIFAGLAATVTLVGTGSFRVRPDPELWWWLAFSIVGGSVITNVIWLQLLKLEDAAVAATQLFMTPLFGLLFGWLILSEHAALSDLAGAALVALGIVLVNQVRPADSLENPSTRPAVTPPTGLFTEGPVSQHDLVADELPMARRPVRWRQS